MHARSFGRVLAALLASAALHAAGATALPDPYPDVARAYYVEVDGRPLWAGQPDARLPMASLTKLMTALLVAEAGAPDTPVATSAAAAAETGTRLGLRAGERVRRGDLLAAMLVRSANDACRALADALGGDEARFVARMNARAAELGLTDSHFTNACGHDADAHYASARDLARLAHAALAQAPIAELVARPGYAFTSLDGRRHALRSTNALLAGLDGARGVKTGSTPAAGRCLIALVERDGVQVLAVLLHAPERWWDSVGLIELAFAAARRGAAP
jgi:D-alanyl-D-alanine carboxypeptidase (penicillin-binding protein 5/6)